MRPEEIIKGAASDGVNLSLSATGSIKFAGNDAAVGRWIDLIREHKAGSVELLGRAGDDWVDLSDPEPPQPAARQSQWWRLHYPDKRPIEVFSEHGDTEAETLAKQVAELSSQLAERAAEQQRWQARESELGDRVRQQKIDLENSAATSTDR